MNSKALEKIKLYQINLNVRERYPEVSTRVILVYDKLNKQIVDNSMINVLKYLDYYRVTYHNENRDTMNKSGLWLASLTATNFQELYTMTNSYLSKEMSEKIVNEMIEMSKDNFVLYE